MALALVIAAALAPVLGERAGVAHADTLYWGGVDPNGVAVPGGVWDFELEAGESDPLEGWTSEDLTDEGVFVRRVTANDFANDPASGLITEGGSMGSLWWGAHEDEANAGCWPGGMGYSNDWSQHAAKTFQYSGTGDVTIAFAYYTDSVDEFDRATVHVVDDLGIVSPPLATYFGQTGFPMAPAHDTIIVDASYLPSGPGPFDVLFSFESDAFFSDGYGDSFGGFLNTTYGPLGVDDVHVTGDGLDDLSDFESGADGWSFHQSPPIGRYLAARHLDELEPVTAGCPLTGHVMLASDVDGPGLTHPEGQIERLVSPPAYVGDTDAEQTLVELDVYRDLSFDEAVGYRVGVRYYPWICPTTLETSWTVLPLNNGGGFFFGGPECDFQTVELVGVPASLESLQVVIDVLADCDAFEVDACAPNGRNQSPYFDNVRLGRQIETVDVDEPAVTPARTRLLAGAPNPFNPRTSIRYELSAETQVTLEIFDAAGRRVRTVVDERRAAGRYRATWDGLDDTGLARSTGVYWLRMRTRAGFESSTRLVLLK
jgi:hypothetical protein